MKHKDWRLSFSDKIGGALKIYIEYDDKKIPASSNTHKKYEKYENTKEKQQNAYNDLIKSIRKDILENEHPNIEIT